jgi:hypothetical protein
MQGHASQASQRNARPRTTTAGPLTPWWASSYPGRHPSPARGQVPGYGGSPRVQPHHPADDLAWSLAVKERTRAGSPTRLQRPHGTVAVRWPAAILDRPAPSTSLARCRRGPVGVRSGRGAQAAYGGPVPTTTTAEGGLVSGEGWHGDQVTTNVWALVSARGVVMIKELMPAVHRSDRHGWATIRRRGSATRCSRAVGYRSLALLAIDNAPGELASIGILSVVQLSLDSGAIRI